MKPEELPLATELPASPRALVGRYGLNTLVMPTASPATVSVMSEPFPDTPPLPAPPPLEQAATVITAAAAAVQPSQSLFLLMTRIPPRFSPDGNAGRLARGPVGFGAADGARDAARSAAALEQPAARPVPAAQLEPGRRLRRALLHGQRATGVEPAARGRADQARRLALVLDLIAARGPGRIGRRRDQQPGVGVGRLPGDLLRGPALDQLAGVHDRRL